VILADFRVQKGSEGKSEILGFLGLFLLGRAWEKNGIFAKRAKKQGFSRVFRDLAIFDDF
jgi:hypothetical protein